MLTKWNIVRRLTNEILARMYRNLQKQVALPIPRCFRQISKSNGILKATVNATMARITGNESTAAAGAFGPMREGNDLDGENYEVFGLAETHPELCQTESAHDAQCKGYTYKNRALAFI